MNYAPLKKLFFVFVLLASLVAFGGRAALGISFLCLIPAAFIALKQIFRKLTLMKMIGLASAGLILPLVLIGGLIALINSHMGERLMAFSSFDDNSAAARWVIIKAFDYITFDELLFGISPARIEEIAYQLGLILPMSDIENPWVLMFMLLGAIMFPFWLGMTGVFIWKLQNKKPLMLKMVILAYFLIASTSNSFGRKDAIYALMVAIVTCAGRVCWPHEMRQ